MPCPRCTLTRAPFRLGMCERCYRADVADRRARGQVGRLSVPAHIRAQRYYVEGDPHECWIWHGKRNRRDRPYIQSGGRGSPWVVAYRVVYEAAAELVLGDDEELHHTCENRSCVNPHHMMVVTREEHETIHYGAHGATDEGAVVPGGLGPEADF